MTVAPTGFPLRGRIRLNQLLNNVRINRNTKFERLELLPIKTVFFQIQSKNPTSPMENRHCSTPSPPPPAICMTMVRMGLLPFGQFRTSIVFVIITI